MRLKWILAIIVVAVLVVATILAGNVELRSRVSDFVTGGGSDNGSGDDGIGPGPTNQTNDTPPVPKILPIAYGYFKGITVYTFSVSRIIDANDQITGYRISAMILKPTAEVYAFNGIADPVYEWTQSKPLSLHGPASNVTVEWWVTIEVQSQFNSQKYYYPGQGDQPSPTFEATWTSTHMTNSFGWTTSDSGSMVTTHTWDSTGRIFYWENGGYHAFLSVNYKFTFNGAPINGIASGGNLLSFQVNV